jgi:hypothetical protein
LKTPAPLAPLSRKSATLICFSGAGAGADAAVAGETHLQPHAATTASIIAAKITEESFFIKNTLFLLNFLREQYNISRNPANVKQKIFYFSPANAGKTCHTALYYPAKDFD